uniref:Uncharacterized protein n=1 Tax=Ditylenchus dipsaci TaxID=166011 RepID=A0A915ERZ4_9BILA
MWDVHLFGSSKLRSMIDTNKKRKRVVVLVVLVIFVHASVSFCLQVHARNKYGSAQVILNGGQNEMRCIISVRDGKKHITNSSVVIPGASLPAIDTLCCINSTTWQSCSHGHPVSPVVYDVNQKIKTNCSMIRVSTTLQSHEDQQETLNDIIQSVDQLSKNLADKLVLVYNSSEAVKAGFVDEKKEEAHKVANEFGRNLGAQGKFQLGELAKKEADDLYPVLFKLAAQYRDTFFTDHQMRMDMHLIPIGKIGKLPKSNSADKQSFVAAVMYKPDQLLTPIAAFCLILTKLCVEKAKNAKKLIFVVI